MKYIKFYCDRYHCNTTFLIGLKESEKLPEYYICPVCEGTVWVDESELIDI